MVRVEPDDESQEQAPVYKKKPVPKALREQVWIKYMGNKLSGKCKIRWCKNQMSAFDFHVGHDIPESKGGTLDIENLYPICSRCNLSMAANYTIKEWNDFQKKKNTKGAWFRRYFCSLT